MMNILFVIGTYNSYGGTERITTVLANAFNGNCSIAAFRGRCEPQKFGLKEGVKCFDLGKTAVMKLRAILIAEKIDIVINQWCLPFGVTRIINKAREGLNVKLVSALHGVPDRSKRVIIAEDFLKSTKGYRRIAAWLRLHAFHAIIKWSIRYVYRKSDAYVVLSDGFIKSFQNYTGLRSTPKLHVIGNPITLPTVYDNRLVMNKKKQILYVGRMDKENKRVNRIIEAWAVVSNDYQDWNLLLVGGGPHLDELRRYVEEHGIERVGFTGFLKDDPIEQYRESSIFMLTSDLEGFGLVLVEAMSYGVVPIVYGSYVAARDIVDDRKNGIVTNVPYSQDETVAALRYLINNDNERIDMARQAIEKAKQFSLDLVVDKWSHMLNGLVGVIGK